MSGQPGAPAPSGTVQAWDSVRRAREPVAWTLLVIAAIIVIISACQLFRLAGATIPVAPTPHVVQVRAGAPHPVGSSIGPGPTQAGSAPVAVSAFSLRASAAEPQFNGPSVVGPLVLSVVLVAFSGGVTRHARQVVSTAAVVQLVALMLGVISLAGAAASHTRPGTWFLLEVPLLALAATALVFTGAVMWSRDLWPAIPHPEP